MERKALTVKQFECTRLRASGLTAGQIARRLRISVHTVKHTLQRAKNRLGVDPRLAAPLLMSCAILKHWGGHRSQFKFGEKLLVVGGVYAGKVAVYDGSINSKQVYVLLNSARLALRRHHLQKMEDNE